MATRMGLEVRCRWSGKEPEPRYLPPKIPSWKARLVGRTPPPPEGVIVEINVFFFFCFAFEEKEKARGNLV